MRFFWFCMLVFGTSYSQSNEVKLLGKEGEHVMKVANEFVNGLSNEKVICFVYVNSGKNTTDYYFGFFYDTEDFIKVLPSYYLILSNGIPLVFFTGFEDRIQFDQKYKDEMRLFAQRYLPPMEVSMSLHYNISLLRFKEGKAIEYQSIVSNKLGREMPLWLTKRYK